ncbi:hypothetical protein VNO77_02772 [Canavalia gladiata]|uniref:Uncharacterized protein n=1 Tax=Canavalia gladiata TaxID=3824 RepID=A0AAN9MTJ1_CANGL
MTWFRIRSYHRYYLCHERKARLWFCVMTVYEACGEGRNVLSTWNFSADSLMSSPKREVISFPEKRNEQEEAHSEEKGSPSRNSLPSPLDFHRPMQECFLPKRKEIMGNSSYSYFSLEPFFSWEFLNLIPSPPSSM